MEILKRKPKRVSLQFRKGVLIARIEQNSLVHELAIREVERVLLNSIKLAHRAIVIDCEELRLQVSSQFMSILMEVQRVANSRGIPLVVCSLSRSLTDCFEITGMSSIIQTFHTREEALEAMVDDDEPDEQVDLDQEL